MLDETRTRFLAAIARQIPADRVIEVHLFSAIKQGGMESGVAVIAAEGAPPLSVDVDGGEPVPAGVAEVAAMDSELAAAVDEQLADESAFVADDVADAEVPDDVAAAADVMDDDADDDVPLDELSLAELAVEVALEESAVEDPGEAMTIVSRAPASRYIVYSARYRHTLKGPDRGKWEVAVTEEADAPLLTVDAVVRGVQRRSGDADETLRLSGDEFRASLPQVVA